MGYVFRNSFFDSYGCPPPVSVLNQLKSKHGRCAYVEYQIQNEDSLSEPHCLHILDLTGILDFKNAVLGLYYQGNFGISTFIRLFQNKTLIKFY